MQEEVSILVDLLLRMRLKKEKWGVLYNLGDFAEVNPTDEELARTLVSCLIGNERE